MGERPYKRASKGDAVKHLGESCALLIVFLKPKTQFHHMHHTLNERVAINRIHESAQSFLGSPQGQTLQIA